MKVKVMKKFGLERKTYNKGDIVDLPSGYDHLIGVKFEAIEKKVEVKPEPKPEVQEPSVGKVEKSIKKKSKKFKKVK